MARLNFKNLVLGSNCNDLTSLFDCIRINGMFKVTDLIGTYAGTDPIIAENMFDSAEFDHIIMSNKSCAKFDICSGMFSMTRGKILEISEFDFSTVTELDHMFYDSAIDNVYIDKIILDSTKSVKGLFSELRCKTLVIDTIDFKSVKAINDMFYEATFGHVKINKITGNNINSICNLCCSAKIGSRLDLSWLKSLTDFACAFSNCQIKGELNLSGVTFDFTSQEILFELANKGNMGAEDYFEDDMLGPGDIELFTDAKIGTLNLVGTQFMGLDSSHANSFSGLVVDKLVISKSDTYTLEHIQKYAKSIGKVVTV